jgi:predicted HAD superfamily Cof-like phosphohydrolase
MSNGLNEVLEEIKKFQITFEHPVANKPQRIEAGRKLVRLSWMQEELDEYREANTIYDEVDALIDALYFILGTFVEMGIQPQPIFDIVQKANMDKVWPDGLVHKKPDGKTIKPEGWQAPEPLIIAEIDRQASA